MLTWPEVENLHCEDYPSMLSIISLILTLPASTSENERVFSRMKITKIDHRSKMKTSTLGDLLMIQLCTHSVREYNPDAAIEVWIRAVRTPPSTHIQRWDHPQEWQAGGGA